METFILNYVTIYILEIVEGEKKWHPYPLLNYDPTYVLFKLYVLDLKVVCKSSVLPLLCK